MSDLGETTINIVDSDNQIIDSCTTFNEEYQSLTMDLPSQPGHYWIIIDSSAIYGEGEFTVQ